MRRTACPGGLTCPPRRSYRSLGAGDGEAVAPGGFAAGREPFSAEGLIPASPGLRCGRSFRQEQAGVGSSGLVGSPCRGAFRPEGATPAMGAPTPWVPPPRAAPARRAGLLLAFPNTIKSFQLVRSGDLRRGEKSGFSLPGSPVSCNLSCLKSYNASCKSY